MHTATREMLRTIGIANDDGHSSLTTNTRNNTTKPFKKSKKEISQKDVMAEFAKENEEDPDDKIDDDEIERYIRTKLTFSKDESVIQLWRKWSINFPQLSTLAISLFGIPASSATSERIFSASGRILEERRQTLNCDVVDDMLFLRNFRKF
jgi:hypothetical protein